MSDTIKLAYNLKTGKVIVCEGRHADDLPTKSFDKFVRAIHFKDKKRLYFRFYDPSGDFLFDSKDEFKEAEAKSFDACWEAKLAFIKAGIIPKNIKSLFWHTDKTISEFDVKP